MDVVNSKDVALWDMPADGECPLMSLGYIYVEKRAVHPLQTQRSDPALDKSSLVTSSSLIDCLGY